VSAAATEARSVAEAWASLAPAVADIQEQQQEEEKGEEAHQAGYMTAGAPGACPPAGLLQSPAGGTQGLLMSRVSRLQICCHLCSLHLVTSV
jgi:hypothetical protein